MKSKEFGRPGGGVRPSRPPRSANDLLSNFSSTAAVVTATLFKRHILITKMNKKDSNDPKVSFLEFLIVLRNYIKKDWLRVVYARQQTQFVTFWGMLSVDAVLEEFDNLG